MAFVSAKTKCAVCAVGFFTMRHNDPWTHEVIPGGGGTTPFPGDFVSPQMYDGGSPLWRDAARASVDGVHGSMFKMSRSARHLEHRFTAWRLWRQSGNISPNLAQKFNSSTKLKLCTSAAITPNRCWQLWFFPSVRICLSGLVCRQI